MTRLEAAPVKTQAPAYAKVCTIVCGVASAILGTLSFVQRIGETREQARAAKVNVVQALVTLLKGVVLFHGKVTKVDQRIEGGFTCGIAYFTGVGTDKGKTFEISFRNEYLLVQSEECPLCITPDLIIVLDEETGMPILTEWLRYGARVVTLGVPANKKWRTSAGIELAGPRAFNYNTDFIPVEKLVASHPPF
ncbi:DUF917 domain-containing protein [Candidatus Fukatsuia symbiotica]|nr:DUF917 domain-containing protein [Candidatus Fukatsuia symbiotica]